MVDLTLEAALNDVDGFYQGDHPELSEAMARVLLKLPEDVREFVTSRVVILSVGQTCAGHTWLARAPWRPEGPNWVIVIDENDDSDREALIAHEIAHAFLGHGSEPGKDDRTTCEKAAADLAKLWGFSGRGTDAKFCAEN